MFHRVDIAVDTVEGGHEISHAYLELFEGLYAELIVNVFQVLGEVSTLLFKKTNHFVLQVGQRPHRVLQLLGDDARVSQLVHFVLHHQGSLDAGTFDWHATVGPGHIVDRW